MFSDESKMEPVNCKIEWKIYNLKKHEEYMQENQFLTSKQFYNPKYPFVKWELRLYLDTAIKTGHLQGTCISLVQVGLKDSSNDSLKAKFIVYTLDDGGNIIHCCTSKIFNFKNQTESDKCEITKTFDPLSLLCEVEFMPYNIKCENKCEDYLNVNTSHRSYINMFKEGIFTDFIIEIEDEEINVHKCVLANNSIVFKTMLEQMGMVEAQNGKMKIVEFTSECFKIMIEYFYSGEVNKKAFERNERYPRELFAMAHLYQVKHLMEICENFIASKIDADNFIHYCNFIQIYHISKLEKACINYFSANKQRIIGSKEWNEFKVKNKDFAFCLLEEKQMFGKKTDGRKQNRKRTFEEGLDRFTKMKLRKFPYI